MTTIKNYHAHVYYGAETIERARKVCEAAVEQFGVGMGTMHQRPVGPHPDWSCLLTVPTEQIGEFLSWVVMNRDGLVIFIHPNTGEDLQDHRDRAIWVGTDRKLNLAQFLS